MAPVRSAGSVDPGWEHGVAQDHSKKKVKCNYCGKVVSGGIYRLKQHLARISGQVTYCNHVPEDVCQKMKENLEGRLCTKRQRQSEDEEQAALKWHSNDDDDDEKEGSTSHKHKGKRLLLDSNSSPILTPLRSLGYVDPGWAHGVVQDEKKKKLKCNYCGKVVSGGINRFKQHLARIPGEVASCKNVPEEVFVKMKDNMKWHRTGRRSRRPETKVTGDFYTNSDNEYEENLEESPENFNSTERLLIGDKSLSRDTAKRFWESTPDNATVPPQTKRSRLESLNLETAKTSTPQLSKQLIVRTGSHKKIHKEAISAISKFFYHTGIPSNVADSPYFCRMLELVGECGQGLKIPSSQVIAGEVLQDEIATIKECLVEFKASCTVTGCTIVADNWKDAQGRTLINILVSCPRGVYFVSSVDATDIVEDPTSLFKLLDKVVDEMGEENVVQVITENTACYKLAGQMLEEKRRNLFWTPCAAHFIDGILEDFLKIKWVEECMDKGKKITKFIYNRESLLNLMKEFTGGRELLRPSATRTSTSFVNLQSLLEHRTAIKRIFQSNKWLSCQFSKSEDGKEVEKIVLNSTFWKKMQFINKSVEPILRVLQKVDSDEGLLLATFHNDMFRAKHQIRAIHGDDIRKYTPFWDVIAHHWSSFFHHPLYMAAYFLNPSYRYRHDFSAIPEAQRGLNDCITRLEPDNGRRVSVSMQVPDFVSAKADFGTELAVTTRAELDPAAWWQQHGINSLELQRIAIRILSQTCSSFGYEHHWSTYYQTHGKIHNHLAQKKVNDYMYVHYNLHLRERQLRKKINNSISLDNVLFESLLDEWTVETDKQTFEEDEEILHDEMEQYENGLHQEAQLVAIFEPLKVHQTTVDDDDDDDDDDLDLLDDDFE